MPDIAFKTRGEQNRYTHPFGARNNLERGSKIHLDIRQSGYFVILIIVSRK